MALDVHMFESLAPSRFTSFSFPNPSESESESESPLRVAVLDSPMHPTDSLSVAAMFVPPGRESDWIFCTDSGHYQLLFNSPGISRLILVGNQPMVSDDSYTIYRRSSDDDLVASWSRQEVSLQPLFLALSPKSCFKNGIPEIPVLSYVDNVVCSVVLEKCIGSSVGEMLVEDVEIEREFEAGKFQTREFRRRLRFKTMPNLIQTEIRIVPEASLDLDGVGIENLELKPDIGVLVHPYLAPMVASLSLIGSSIDKQIQNGFRPKVLCVGVGGGALLTFLATLLEFEVLGVEVDKEVFRVARQYFGLIDNEFIHICIGDAIEFIEAISNSVRGQSCGSSGVHQIGNACQLDDDTYMFCKYDVIMVDLDSTDATNGTSAPPLEFVRRDVLLAARSVLSELGILVINVIPPNKLFYETLVDNFRSVFCDLYQIDVDNGENYVLIASVSPITSFTHVTKNTFLSRLRLLISGVYLDSIKKI